MTRDEKKKRWKTIAGDAISVVANLNFVTGFIYATGAAIWEYLRLAGREKPGEDSEEKESETDAPPKAE